jgi:hypothetical protein
MGRLAVGHIFKGGQDSHDVSIVVPYQMGRDQRLPACGVGPLDDDQFALDGLIVAEGYGGWTLVEGERRPVRTKESPAPAPFILTADGTPSPEFCGGMVVVADGSVHITDENGVQEVVHDLSAIDVSLVVERIGKVGGGSVNHGIHRNNGRASRDRAIAYPPKDLAIEMPVF